MNARELLDQIAYRLEEKVQDGDATENERAIYLIAIGRKCAWCEAEPGDNEHCVSDGSPHPWVNDTHHPGA